MADRPYTILSCAVTLDGYLDDATERRLRLSGPADLDRVDELRSTCDAILVGAATVRNDDPRLLVRDPGRVATRPAPVKVTVTERAKLDRDCRFFRSGDAGKLVYCGSDRYDDAVRELGDLATVVDAGRPPSMSRVGADLHGRGIRRLLVEGGATVLTQFLTEDVADELHLVVAPFFVGDARARRWADEGTYPWSAGRRARLLESRTLDDVVLLRYALSDRCDGEGN